MINTKMLKLIKINTKMNTLDDKINAQSISPPGVGSPRVQGAVGALLQGGRHAVFGAARAGGGAHHLDEGTQPHRYRTVRG